MTAFSRFRTAAFFIASALFTSCLDNVFDPGSFVGGGSGTKDEALTGVMLGYDGTHAYNDKEFSLEDGNLVYFLSGEELERMASLYPGQNLETSNRVSYNTGVYPVRIKVKPDDTMIKSWVLTSSDPSIIEVTDYKTLDVDRVLGIDEAVLHVKGVGECSLRLSVAGKNDLEAEYPMKAVASTTLKFKCSPFWRGNLITRIHWTCRDVPDNVKDVVFEVSDSVRVIGEVRYYDYGTYGSAEQVIRDTVTFPNETFHKRFRRNTYHMLRNVTSGVRAFRDMKQAGTAIVWNPYMLRYDTVYTEYSGSAKHVECILGLTSDNPYLEFTCQLKPGRSYDTTDKDGNIIDGGSDGEEADDGDSSSPEDITPYFSISINDGLTQAQRDSLNNALSAWKKEIGYDADNLTDAEKDALIDRMNERTKDWNK